MAKRHKLQIDWNGVTVADINRIITHFADAEQYYVTHTREAKKHGRPCTFASSIPIVQSRQRFWKDMISCVERGEKISSPVREYLTYCRNSMEFSR